MLMRTSLQRTCAATGVLGLLVLPAAAQPFYPDDPVRRELPPRAVVDLQPRALSQILETISNTLGTQGERHPEGGVIPAGGVNTLGEVMDGAWYVNRHGTRRMTREELVRGAGDSRPPSTDAPWQVLLVKPFGSRTGLLVADTRRELYLLRFDPTGQPELATGAEMVASRFFYALGYHVAENYIVDFARDGLAVAESAQVVSSAGNARRAEPADVDSFLEDVAAARGGRFRAVATRLPRAETEILGPYQLFGTRSDDPNDVVPHEHRRDLRGLFVFSAWLGYSNMRAVNTVDIVVEEGGVPHVRHYLADFMTTLGSGVYDGPKQAWEGRELLYPSVGTIAANTFGFGIYTKDWMRARYPNLRGVGRFDARTFHPERWTTNYELPPFANRLPDDDFWAARQVLAFTDEDIRALVETGKYSHPRAVDWIAASLAERRDRIGRAFLGVVLPLDRFRVENGSLAFEDVGAAHGATPPQTYAVTWLAYDNGVNRTSALGATGTQVPSEALRLPPGAYVAARISGAETDKAVTVYLRRTDATFEVVGIDRTWPGKVVATPTPPRRGPSRYPALTADQRRLFDPYAAGLNARTGRSLGSQAMFDAMALSEQTTFDAVTDALRKSKLTDASGAPLGTAIELVEGIDRIAGQYAGRGGDQQFRLYVRLKPDARETLEKSQEFFRDHENTVYHAGYPHSYRQVGKEPNMQFSLAADGLSADIDVDYRSSRSPQALFNGHLTAANSDVRVGKNPQLHNGRWNGFVAWWANVFGRVGEPTEHIRDYLSADVPEVPTPLPPNRPAGASPERVEDAVQEFLTDWLVRREYDEALDFLSDRAYACLNEDDQAGNEILDTSQARAALSELMEYSTREMGRRFSLTDATVAVEPQVPRAVVDQPFAREFTIFPLDEAEAQQYLCGRKPDGQTGTTYYAALFRFRKEDAGVLGLLWSKEAGAWRMAAYRTLDW
jgi:hypothetical protein